MAEAAAVHQEQGQSFEEIAEQLKAVHERTAGFVTKSLQQAQKAGDLLLDVKERMRHGRFTPWIEENLPFGVRTARRYMRVARVLRQLEEQNGHVSDFAAESIREFLGAVKDTRADAGPQQTVLPDAWLLKQLEGDERKYERILDGERCPDSVEAVRRLRAIIDALKSAEEVFHVKQ